MLEVKDLQVSYGAINALHGVSLTVKQGDIVTLIGANGAGKSTTLRAISGLIKARGGEITYQGRTITNRAPHEIVKLGISQVPEGRMIFANLALEVSRYGYVLETGRIALQDESAALRQNPQVKSAYLGG